jgi:hypothetical protein
MKGFHVWLMTGGKVGFHRDLFILKIPKRGRFSSLPWGVDLCCVFALLICLVAANVKGLGIPAIPHEHGGNVC